MHTCPKCRTENKTEDRFCQGCGEVLDAGNDTKSLVDIGIVCPGCDTFNEPNQKACIKCGQFLGGLTEILAAMGKTSEKPTMRSIPRIVLIRGAKIAESTFGIDASSVSIGRQGATIVVTEDPFLSPVHAVIEQKGNRLLVRDADSLNGTFIRIRDSIELCAQAELIAGHQRLLLLGAGGATTDTRLNPPKDTRPYGSPVPKYSYLAFRLLHADEHGKAKAGTIMLRSGPVVTVGQQGCDLNFPTDPWMAPCHFELHLQGSKIRAVVSSESKGVFLRIKEPIFLKNADEILMGEELFRVEIPQTPRKHP